MELEQELVQFEEVYILEVESLPEFVEPYYIPEEIEAVLEALYMDDNPHPFSFTDHWRGRSVHLDHRWLRGTKKGGILDGMTVAHMRPGIVKEAVQTMKRARELMKIERNWKISNEPGPLRMFATPKRPEPYEWLYYQGVVPPREVAPGIPGATRFEWGVFVTRDKGVQYYGAQKPYFKEFFLYGKKYTGRWIYRMIPRRRPVGARAAFLFLFGKPIDQDPYVLSRRAETDKWVPPQGVSCLPPEIKKKIPDKLQYWKLREEKRRLEVRSELREAIKAGRVKLEEDMPYVLQHHAFRKKGKKPVRVGFTDEHWDFRVVKRFKPPYIIHFVLAENPLEKDVVASYEKPCYDLKAMEKEGFIPPGTPEWNPSKETLAWVFIIDKGTADILEDSHMFKKFKVKGKKLKSLYIWKREARGQPMGTFEKSALPGD